MEKYTNTDNIQVLLHCNGKDGQTGNMKDVGKDHLITGGVLSTDDRVFGNSSLKFNANKMEIIPRQDGDKLDFNLGKTFTIDFRFKITNNSNCTLLETPGWSLRYKAFASGVGALEVSFDGNTNKESYYGLKTDIWYNVRLVGNGDVCMMFIDNCLAICLDFQGNTGFTCAADSNLILGNNSASTSGFNGFIDEFILVKDECWMVENYGLILNYISVPDIDLNDTHTGVAGVPAPKIVSMYKLGFYASLHQHYEWTHAVFDKVYITLPKTLLENNKVKLNIETGGDGHHVYYPKLKLYEGEINPKDYLIDFPYESPCLTSFVELYNTPITSFSSTRSEEYILPSVGEFDLSSVTSNCVTIFFDFYSRVRSMQTHSPNKRITNFSIVNSSDLIVSKIPQSDLQYITKIDYTGNNQTPIEMSRLETGTFQYFNDKTASTPFHVSPFLIFNNETLDKYNYALAHSWNLNDNTLTKENLVNNKCALKPGNPANTTGITIEEDATYGKVLSIDAQADSWLKCDLPKKPEKSVVMSAFVNFTYNSGYNNIISYGKENDDRICVESYRDDFRGCFYQTTPYAYDSIYKSSSDFDADWHHVTIIWSSIIGTSEGNVRVYTDGVINWQGASTSVLTNTDNMENVFYVGATGKDAAVRNLEFKITQINLWEDINFASTADIDTFVSALYNNGDGRMPVYNYQLNRAYPSGHVIDAFALDEASGNRISEKFGKTGVQTSVGSGTGIGRTTCATFNGSSSKLEINDDRYASVFESQIFSVGIWMKSTSTSDGVILSNVNNGNGFDITLNADKTLSINFHKDSSVITKTISGNYANNIWHRVWVLVNTDTIKIIIDNEILLFEKDLSNDVIGAGSNTLTLGSDGTNYYSGNLEEFVTLDIDVDKIFLSDDYNNQNGRFYYVSE